ncbi:DUF4270 domain-containing protein [Flavobacterium saccharophilum]|uniref:DUF4270 domain-containing protein n=1 Tax=Flavobacterium saccharophilum TaxID=29534 RepID=A0A1M6ZIL3_9FLAO|nr:DUF4270 domain-containing protein [Flavobacterium saccharophilum]SHL30312.1 protein of unknown function [Flavobacterium saccharophilum]
MYNTSFIKKILLVATVVLLYSCDKDFNAIGDDLIGDNHFDLQGEKYDVLAYNQEVTPVQSNALAVNGLGIYDNPVLGTTTGNFATQLTMATYAPTIGAEAVVDSVMLSIPYFKHVKSVETNGSTIYELDSIFGSPEGKLKLSIYESGVQMRTSFYDNGSQMAQLYYTDQNADFDNFKKGDRLNDNNENKNEQNDKFGFSAKEIIQVTKDDADKKVITRVAPEMHLKLNNTFFQDKILNAPADKLANANVFQEYFRGLYFKVEKSESSPSNMALLDFAKGKITIYYKAKTAITTDLETVKENKTLDISLGGGATASLLNDVKNVNYDTAIKNPDNVNGDEKLYLKGGQGSLAVIDLSAFGTKLAEIRENKWMVNEANLVFYIDADKMTGAEEPKRVYLYDLTNNIPVIDYADGTSGFLGSDSKATRYIFGGIIETDATTKRGKSYKVRITNHIRNLIKDATATNVKLGLVVTEDISIFASNKLKLKNSVISEAPKGSVTSPLGTILYGSKASVPEAQRLRLEVYYTKPN